MSDERQPLVWHANAQNFSGEQLLLCHPCRESSAANLNSESAKHDLAFLPPRWPVECQVVQEAVNHMADSPHHPEEYYSADVIGSGVLDEDVQFSSSSSSSDHVVYSYDRNSRTSCFSKSIYQSIVDPVDGSGESLDLPSCDFDTANDRLVFESRFESANLQRSVRVSRHQYELHLHRDLYTNRHSAWFYFQISNVKPNITYRFAITNLSRGWCLYNSGMRPLMYSVRGALEHGIGWRRVGTNIAYYPRNNNA